MLASWVVRRLSILQMPRMTKLTFLATRSAATSSSKAAAVHWWPCRCVRTRCSSGTSLSIVRKSSCSRIRKSHYCRTLPHKRLLQWRMLGYLASCATAPADLARSVDELTATGDVLKVISRSSVDLKTVLDTLCETVARLCRADQTPLYRRRDDKHYLVAAWGMSEKARKFALAHPLTPGRGSLVGRVILERRAIHIPDVLQDPEYTYREGQKIIGYRTLLGIPLLREQTLDRHICRLAARASNPSRTKRSSLPPASPIRR